jgi:hypothetical protein
MPDAICIPCPVIKKKKSALITFLVLKKGKKKGFNFLFAD